VRILIVGATGALGRDVVEAALRDGHDTAAMVRDPARAELPEAVELVEGDVLDAASLRAAVEGREAVICALGTPSARRASTLLQDGTRNLVVAMDQAGVRRLVCVTLLGIGTSRANGSLVYRQVILRALAPMLPDKQAQEDVVRSSKLDWTVVRPPRFTGGKPGGEVRVIAEGQPARVGHVVRADLADFLLDCATDNRHLREALAVGSSAPAPELMKLRPRVAVLLSGLLTGSELTSWGIVHPTLWKLEHAAQVRAEKLVYRRFGTVDPFLQTATIVACFATAQGLRGRDRALALAAGVSYSIMLAITLIGNMPINLRVFRWDETHGDPEQWRILRRRWDRLHAARIALDTAGFTLITTATVQPRV
jgi:uncharacterized protein YbjT (DUF2867 family)